MRVANNERASTSKKKNDGGDGRITFQLPPTHSPGQGGGKDNFCVRLKCGPAYFCHCLTKLVVLLLGRPLLLLLSHATHLLLGASEGWDRKEGGRGSEGRKGNEEGEKGGTGRKEASKVSKEGRKTSKQRRRKEGRKVGRKVGRKESCRQTEKGSWKEG